MDKACLRHPQDRKKKKTSFGPGSRGGIFWGGVGWGEKKITEVQKPLCGERKLSPRGKRGKNRARPQRRNNQVPDPLGEKKGGRWKITLKYDKEKKKNISCLPGWRKTFKHRKEKEGGTDSDAAPEKGTGKGNCWTG